MVVLHRVVKPMNPGEIPFLDQFRLRLQPVLNIATGQRTLVLITKIGSAGHLVRCRRKISFVLVQCRRRK